MKKYDEHSRKMKNISFTRKNFDDSQGLPLLFYFSSKSSTIFMILFENVSLSRRKSTTKFGISLFLQKKSDKFHWT